MRKKVWECKGGQVEILCHVTIMIYLESQKIDLMANPFMYVYFTICGHMQ